MHPSDFIPVYALDMFSYSWKGMDDDDDDDDGNTIVRRHRCHHLATTNAKCFLGLWWWWWWQSWWWQWWWWWRRWLFHQLGIWTYVACMRVYLHVNTLTGFQNNLCVFVRHVLVEKYNHKYVIFWQFISVVLSEPKHLFSCCLIPVGEYLVVYFDRRFYKFVYCYLFSPLRKPGRPVISCIQGFRRWHLGWHCCPWRFLNWMV